MKITTDLKSISTISNAHFRVIEIIGKKEIPVTSTFAWKADADARMVAMAKRGGVYKVVPVDPS